MRTLSYLLHFKFTLAIVAEGKDLKTEHGYLMNIISLSNVNYMIKT